MNGFGTGRRVPFERDLVFLHHLEKRALRLCRRAIDFVGEEQLREHRAADHAQLARRGIEDRVPRDVGRQHVGRELDAPVRQRERLRERADEQRLAEPRHAFDEDVTGGDERDEDLLDDGRLADHGLVNAGAERPDHRRGFIDCVQLRRVHVMTLPCSRSDGAAWLRAAQSFRGIHAGGAPAG